MSWGSEIRDLEKTYPRSGFRCQKILVVRIRFRNSGVQFFPKFLLNSFITTHLKMVSAQIGLGTYHTASAIGTNYIGTRIFFTLALDRHH